MTYPKLLVYFVLPAFLVIFAVLSAEGKPLFPFDLNFFYALIVAYFFWWLVDRVGIKNAVWVFDRQKTSGIWMLGAPLEDHITMIAIVAMIKYLMVIFA